MGDETASVIGKEMPSNSAIGAAEFAHALDRLAPFEPAPHLAVAVSGGPDSMALALLAANWAGSQSGSLTALTVDHQLRPGSRDEAVQTGIWLKARGIAHVILTREGPPPSGDIQAAAREARYGLLREWCQEHGVLHLLVAHHREDQAETLLLRLGRGSGLYGLSAMAVMTEEGPCRLLRPLLTFSHHRLLATLAAARQTHIQDPSNNNPSFSRVRLRQAMPSLAPLGLSAERLAETARHLGQSRAALEAALERMLAKAVTLHPAGFVRLDRELFSLASLDLRARALAAIICMIGNQLYPPRFERLERLMVALSGTQSFKPCTLGGCGITADATTILLFRELSAVAPMMRVTLSPFLWDRFEGAITPSTSLDDLTIGAFGLQNNSNTELNPAQHINGVGVPKKLWPALPALRRKDRIIAVPHLGWGEVDLLEGRAMRFQPVRSLTNAGFFAA